MNNKIINDSNNFIFFVLVYHMKSTGWVHISDEDCKDIHYKILEQKENAIST